MNIEQSSATVAVRGSTLIARECHVKSMRIIWTKNSHGRVSRVDYLI